MYKPLLWYKPNNQSYRKTAQQQINEEVVSVRIFLEAEVEIIAVFRTIYVSCTPRARARSWRLFEDLRSCFLVRNPHNGTGFSTLLMSKNGHVRSR